MATSNIIIQQSDGNEVSQSRDDLVLGVVVTLLNLNNTGVTSWLWQIVDKPDGSTATLSSSTGSTSTFTPDIEGTYLIKLIINGGQATDQKGAAVKTSNLHYRIPAASEEGEFDSIRGWAEAVNDALRKIDDGYMAAASTGVPASRTLTGAFGIVGGGDLSSNRTFSLATFGTAGTYNQVHVDAYGRISSGSFMNLTLQNIYDNSTPSTVVLNSNGGLIIQNNSTPIGGSLLSIQDNAGVVKYLDVTDNGDLSLKTLGGSIIVDGSNLAIATFRRSGVTRGNINYVTSPLPYFNFSSSMTTVGTSVTNLAGTGLFITGTASPFTDQNSASLKSTGNYSVYANGSSSGLQTAEGSLFSFSDLANGGVQFILAGTSPVPNAPVTDITFDFSRDNNAISFDNSAGSTTFSVSSFLIKPPKYDATVAGPQTLNAASTVTIVGAPASNSSNLVINSAISLWVQSGTTQFDGTTNFNDTVVVDADLHVLQNIDTFGPSSLQLGSSNAVNLLLGNSGIPTNILGDCVVNPGQYIANAGSTAKMRLGQKANGEIVWSTNVDQNNGDAMDAPSDSAWKFAMQTAASGGYDALTLQHTPTGNGGWSGTQIFRMDGTGLTISTAGADAGYGHANIVVSATGNNEAGIKINNTANDGYAYNIFATGSSSGLGNHKFVIGDINGFTHRFVIDSATGNTGIGTSTPSAKLDINGDIKVEGDANIAGSSNKIGFYGATAVAKQTQSGNTATGSAGSTTNVFTNTTFTGGVGATAYTIGDIVKILKNLGLITS